MGEIVRNEKSEGAYALSTACFVVAAVTAPLVGVGLPLAALPLGCMILGVTGVLLPRISLAPAASGAVGAARAASKAWREAGMGPRLAASLARGRVVGLRLAARSGESASALGTHVATAARQVRSEWAARQGSATGGMVPVRVRPASRRG